MYEEFPFEHYYAFVCTDSENSNVTRELGREAHVARLNKLREEGRLLLAGPLLDAQHQGVPKGGLIIAQFNSLPEAEEWLKEEPYLKVNAYQDVTIFAYKNVFINSVQGIHHDQ
ncbi:YciI family protein [Legionella bononiensis]|uniref:YCII-related domain-containing protein n=1 Tax=Legionella bononiensis TaxID=2793102 RepID=A0ABS1WD91_9GAMM|nr:YciI family protein [Legionella bononiensis]MBL7481214.1 hypothetical protein [Legionella bononiensis]MBL7527320.1 hypothetical protein [Legionella bononiensis]MBL7562289.1 hypothetical protein [Legionella bononiensis]